MLKTTFRNLLILFVAHMLFAGSLIAQSTHQAAIDSASALVKSVQERYKTPGLAVSVSKEGKMVWSDGFGFADIDNGIKVDPSSTKFRVGSVSKTLTATALGKLYEEEKLIFDDTVQVYVSYFPVKKYPISVRQVAGHIAGIRHYKDNEFLSDKYFPTVRSGISIFEDDPLLFEPGTQYKYSSYGWNLVSAVIEGASQEEFLVYMSNLFNEKGMENTEPDIAGEENEDRTKFYMLESNKIVKAPFVDNSYKWAGGGFISTSEDLILFGNAHLYNSYLNRETFNILTASQHLKNGTATNYGMGWASGQNDQGLIWVGHSGGSVGGITMFAIYPEYEIVIAMCSNSSSHKWEGIHHILASLFSSQ